MHIVLNSPLDMHLHLREGHMLRAVAPLTTAFFAGAVIMPNLVSPVDSLAKVLRYKEQIETAGNLASFAAYMTLFFDPLFLKLLQGRTDGGQKGNYRHQTLSGGHYHRQRKRCH